MKRLLRWGAATAALLLLAVVVLGVLNYRPLIETEEWEATSNEGARATVYRMLFDPNRLYLEFPEAENPHHRWFALDLDRQVAGKPNWPKRSPYLHVNQGQGIGVGLTGMKLGEPWKVEWGAGVSSFAGPDFTFTLSRSGANQEGDSASTPPSVDAISDFVHHESGRSFVPKVDASPP